MTTAGTGAGNITQAAGYRITGYKAVAVDGAANTTGSKTQDLTGLDGAIGDGITSVDGLTYGMDSYLGVTATLQQLWRSVIHDGGNATADSSMLRNASSKVAVTSKDPITDLFSHQFIRDGYADNLEDNRLYYDSNFAGGYDKLTFSDNGRKLGWTVDKWATMNTIYGVALPRTYLGVTADLDFDDNSGAILIPDPGRGMFHEFRMAWWGQFVLEKRSSAFRIVRVANSAGSGV